jgi:hypothetical protein
MLREAQIFWARETYSPYSTCAKRQAQVAAVGSEDYAQSVGFQTPDWVRPDAVS